MTDPTDFGAAQIVSGGGAFSDYSDYELGYSPATRKASEILNQVRRTFGDQSGTQIADTDVWAWISDAQDEIINANQPLKTRSFTYSIAHEPEYQFPGANIGQLDAVHYDLRPLKSTTFAQVQQEDLDPNTADGTPQFWYEYGGAFRLWPTPSVAKRIDIFYSARPTRVTTGTQLLSLPDKYFQAIRDYVLAQAYELDENWSAMQAKLGRFDQNLAARAEEERTAQNATYDTATFIESDQW